MCWLNNIILQLTTLGLTCFPRRRVWSNRCHPPPRLSSTPEIFYINWIFGWFGEIKLVSVGFDLILNFKTKSKRTGEDHLHLHLHFLALCTILSFTSASFSFLLATSTTFTLRGSRRKKLPAFPNKSRIWVSNPFSCKQLGHWSTCNISLKSVRGRWFTGCWVWGTGLF